MTSTSTRVEAIVRYLSGVGDDYSINNETDLRTDLQLDSLDLIETTIKIEREFNIDITDEETDKPALGTFGGLVAFVQGKLDADPDRKNYGTLKIPPGAVIESGIKLHNPPDLETVNRALDEARERMEAATGIADAANG